METQIIKLVQENNNLMKLGLAFEFPETRVKVTEKLQENNDQCEFCVLCVRTRFLFLCNFWVQKWDRFLRQYNWHLLSGVAPTAIGGAEVLKAQSRSRTQGLLSQLMDIPYTYVLRQMVVNLMIVVLLGTPTPETFVKGQCTWNTIELLFSN